MLSYIDKVWSRTDQEQLETHLLWEELGSISKTARRLGISVDKCKHHLRLAKHHIFYMRRAGFELYTLMPLRSAGLSNHGTAVLNALGGECDKLGVSALMNMVGVSIMDTKHIGPEGVREVYAWLGEDQPHWLKTWVGHRKPRASSREKACAVCGR